MEDSKVMQIPRCIKIEVGGIFFMIVFFTFSITEFTRSLFGHLSQQESFLQDTLCDQTVFVSQEWLVILWVMEGDETLWREEWNITFLTMVSLFFLRKEKWNLAQNGNRKIIFGANFPVVMFIVFICCSMATRMKRFYWFFFLGGKLGLTLVSTCNSLVVAFVAPRAAFNRYFFLLCNYCW